MPGQAKHFQVRAKLEPSLGSDLALGNKTKAVLLKHIVNLMNNEIQRKKFRDQAQIGQRQSA